MTDQRAIGGDGAARPAHRPLDVVVVGAGFAGLYSLHKLRTQGLTVRVYEACQGFELA